MPLYTYEEDICFIFGRLHFYINKWFEESRTRIEKGNFYLTSGSRAEINDIEKAVKQLQKFFDKLNYSLSNSELEKQ